ncbi:hypothetical protein [Natrononativus amylolyticus]|uniref:hypothetical protein n=1 Tax=Natrononativus amylolyticus TaxID=2963434 RepID=UPI0020CFB050|nr:hypothetical protein [Natrononativus amylolyticus]
MSSPPATHDRRPSSARTVASDGQETNQSALERFSPTIARHVRVTSFWMAIVLPFLHVPLLATGLSTPSETATFLGLLVLNLVALYLGHSHRN